MNRNSNDNSKTSNLASNKQELPKISIVTPSYNQGEFLEETILSIINQNYPNLEYIIIDGGSTDNSLDIIKKYEKNIHYWVSEKDKGQSHAINKGFAKATGDICNWINSDDKLCENSLFTIAKAYINHPNENLLLIGNGYEIDEKSNIVRERKVITKEENSRITSLPMKGNPIQQSFFFTKNLFLEAGGTNPYLKYAMDIDLYFKFKFLNPEVFIINDYIGCFRKHSASKTISQDHKMLIEKINLFLFLSEKTDDKKEVYNQISSYITSFNFKNISFLKKLNLFKIFIQVTPFNRKTKYKFKIIFYKFLKS